MQRLRALNPAAPIVQVLNGAVDPGRLFDAGLYNPKTKSLDVQRWLNAEAYLTGDRHEISEHSHDAHGDQHEVAHAHDINRHDEHITAFCLTLDAPIDADVFEPWLDLLVAFQGPDLLRVKGILNVLGFPGPVVIHGVQHVFHPTVYLKQWPSKDQRSRIVFIGRDLPEAALRDTFKLVTAEGKGAAEALSAQADGSDIPVFELPL